MDHCGEAVDFAPDHLEELVSFFRGEEFVGILEEFCGIEDRGQRGTEFVGDESDELAFESAEVLGFLEADHHAVFDLSAFGDVLDRADGADGFIIGAEFELGLFADPMDGVIGDDAEFDVVFFAVECGLPLFPHCGAVIRVDSGDEVVEVEGLIGWEAVEAVGLG